MAEVRVRKNESLDNALRRFKRSCAKDGLLAEVRRREHYQKPSVRRKKKSEAARKNAGREVPQDELDPAAGTRHEGCDEK